MDQGSIQDFHWEGGMKGAAAIIELLDDAP